MGAGHYRGRLEQPGLIEDHRAAEAERSGAYQSGHLTGCQGTLLTRRHNDWVIEQLAAQQRAGDYFLATLEMGCLFTNAEARYQFFRYHGNSCSRIDFMLLSLGFE